MDAQRRRRDWIRRRVLFFLVSFVSFVGFAALSALLAVALLALLTSLGLFALLRSYLVAYALAVFAAKIAEIQMNAGRFFLAENPWQSELWNLPCWPQVLKR